MLHGLNQVQLQSLDSLDIGILKASSPQKIGSNVQGRGGGLHVHACIFIISRLSHSVAINPTEQGSCPSQSNSIGTLAPCCVIHLTLHVIRTVVLEQGTCINSCQCIKMNSLNISVSFLSLEFRNVVVHTDKFPIAQYLLGL